MSVSEDIGQARWTIAEAHMISQYAYERYIAVEPAGVLDHIAIWREWYYGMIPYNVVLLLPGVHRIDVSGR